MKFFTDEEFDTIFREIVLERPSCYDTMLLVAERMMMGSVRKWCNEEPCLNNEYHVQEIMQLIRIRLYQKCVTGFFMRNGEPNYDPEGFKNWIFTVALNVKRDYAKKVRQLSFKEGNGTDDFEPEDLTSEQSLVISEEKLAMLNRAFCIVISHHAKVHIILTWLAMMLLIAVHGFSKIEATDALIRVFDSMTLDTMHGLILRYMAAIPWLQQDEGGLASLKKRLDKRDEKGIRIGDKVYHDFYMKKGGKASVSDWAYRMNQIVEKEEGTRK